MSIKDKFPAIKPSLNLDFANTKRLDPRITFSRASTGTYYDGVTHAKAEENLLSYSQEFENAYWDDDSVTVTANDTTAPDGTTTADKLAVPGDSTPQYILKNSVFTQTSTGYALSIYAKAGTLSYFFLAYRGNSSNVAIAEWDLSTGTLNASNASGTAVIDSTAITSVGSGWYRLVLNVTTSTSNTDARFAFGPTDGTFSNFGYYTGSTAGDAYAWGAQLEQRSSVTAYTATTTQPITNYIPVLQSAAAGEARFDHDPLTGESKGLLIEEQRTNLVTYSEDFSNGSWTKLNASIDSNVIVAPDGTLTGDKLVENTTTALKHQIYKGTGTTAGSFSIYAKSAERSILGVYAGAWFSFDLSAGIATGTGANIEDVGDGWFRCFVPRTNTGDVFLGPSINTVVSDPSWEYNGDGYSGVYIWGAQLEAGAFPTSYIKTTSAQATRNADSASMTGTNFSEWYRQDEGSVYAELSTNQDRTTSNSAFTFDSGSAADEIRNIGSSYQIRNNSVLVVNDSSAFSVTAGKHKLSAAYKTNDCASSDDGATVRTDTNAVIPNNLTTLRIGTTSDNRYLDGTIKRLTYYPARLTNAQLQALTEG